MEVEALKQSFEKLEKGLKSVTLRIASYFTPQNIIRFFTHNILSKLLAVGFAMIIWIYVIAGTNPVTDRVFYDVPVKIEGESMLDTRGLVLTHDAYSYVDTVQVSVRANHRSLLTMTNQSIIARLDFGQIIRTGDQKVQITASLPGILGEVLEIKPDTVDVTVNTRATKSVPMNIKLEGKLKNGLWNSPPQAAIQEIVVTGPDSQIDDVAYAQVTIDLSGINADVQSSLAFYFYDEDDNLLDYSKLSTVYGGSVMVNMKVYPSKEVPVEIEWLGQLPEGLELDSFSILPDKVRVVAAREDIDALSSIKASVQLSKIAEDHVELVPISALSGWIRVIPEEVEVRVIVREQHVNHTFTVPVKIEGSVGSYLYIAEPQEVEVVINGEPSKVRELSDDSFTAVVDVSDLEPGQHEVMPKIVNPPSGFDPVVQSSIVVEVIPTEE